MIRCEHPGCLCGARHDSTWCSDHVPADHLCDGGCLERLPEPAPLNLYLLTQSVNDDYDSYDAVIVAAHNEDDALAMHPAGTGVRLVGERGAERWVETQCSNPPGETWEVEATDWALPNDVEVQLLGVAEAGVERGVILARNGNPS